jgi:Chalcone isomerase-like
MHVESKLAALISPRMSPLTRRSLLWTLCVGLSLPLMGVGRTALAQEAPRVVEGQPFARRVQLAGSELQLNGTGVRAVAWFKGYAAGLYLTQPGRDLAQVQMAPGPKRLQLRLLQDVPAAEFVKALRKGIERNTPPDELPTVAPSLQQLATQIEALGSVRKGDTVDLDLDPARGLLLSLNGTLRGQPVPGDVLYRALLRAFLGEHPYDTKLKAGLLAGLSRTGP